MTEPGARTYLVTWLALVILATLTFALSRVDLGDGNLLVALAIAAVKAGLVLAIFMDLAHGRPLHRLVIGIAIVFVILVVVGVLADVGTRSLASAYVTSP